MAVKTSHNTSDITLNTKYCTSYLTQCTQREVGENTIISLGSFLSLLDLACLHLNSFSAPDALLDILSPRIIRFSLLVDIRAEPVSDVAPLGGT